MRQDYNSQTIQRIIDQYEQCGSIKAVRLFTSGFENSNYFVQTDCGTFVVKVFEGIGVHRENILFELDVMDASFRAGIKTPHILRTRDNSLASSLDEKYAMVMDYIDGENMNQKEISDAIAYELGKIAGSMDTTLAVFTSGEHTRQNYEWDTKNFLILEPKISYLDSVYDRDLLEKIFDNFRVIKPAFDKLPTGLIHNDIALHNILMKDGQLKAVIDFSDMAFSPYIQNITVSMAQLIFCYNWKPIQAGLFIKGYREYHPLSNQELALLYDLVCARYATLVIEFTYWNKVLFGVDSQRSEAINDFYQFLLRFMKLGKTAFNQLIGIEI